MKRSVKIGAIFTIGLLIVSMIIPAVSSVNVVKDLDVEEKENVNIKAGDGETEYYAVISACSSYEDPSGNLPVGPLKLRALYFSLLAADNWKMQNIMLLINEDASRSNLLLALDTMASRVDGDDVFLFSWMGHGSQVPDDNNDERTLLKPLDRFDEVICPWDCKRDDDGNLIDFIRDDTLEQKFNAIGGKGQCLIFESCFSGGLVSSGIFDSTLEGQEQEKGFELIEAYSDDFISSEEAEDFTADFKEQFEEDDGGVSSSDLNGKDRIVIMASMDDCVARVTLLFGGPLTTSLAFGFLGLLKGDAKDKNQNGFLSVEEAFRWARPRAFGMLSLYWGFIYLYCLGINVDYDPDPTEDIPWFKDPAYYESLIDAIPDGTKMFISEFLYVQVYLWLLSGSFVWSFPHKVDRYHKLGGLDIISLKDHEETDAMDTMGLPASFGNGPTQAGYDHYVNYMLTETPIKDSPQEVKDKWVMSEDDYLSATWDDVPDQYKPTIAAEASASTTEEEVNKEIQFYGQAVGGYDPITYEWDFGDGTTSNEVNPTHAFTEAGSYSVTLTVTDGQGNTGVDINKETGLPSLTVEIEEESSRSISSLLIMVLLKHFPVLQQILKL